uniref:Small cell adhesion glycoprotein n=1 Tax=Amazona collaria TaxID=241587 RepID=A0A8B9FA34_9PSIT
CLGSSRIPKPAPHLPTEPLAPAGAARPCPAPAALFVITLVFLTLLTVLVVIIIYLYRNKGSYLTYEQPAAETDVSVQMEDAPAKEKEEYFI